MFRIWTILDAGTKAENESGRSIFGCEGERARIGSAAPLTEGQISGERHHRWAGCKFQDVSRANASL
jgi:hypothetical protein